MVVDGVLEPEDVVLLVVEKMVLAPVWLFRIHSYPRGYP
jgi:hypothetical protein